MSIVYDALKKIEQESHIKLGVDFFNKDSFSEKNTCFYKKKSFLIATVILFILCSFALWIGVRFLHKAPVVLQDKPEISQQSNTNIEREEVSVAPAPLEADINANVSAESVVTSDQVINTLDNLFDELYEKLSQHKLDEVNARLAPYKADTQYLASVEKLSTMLLTPQNASVLTAFLLPIVVEHPDDTLLRQNLASAYYLEGHYSDAIRMLIVSVPEEKYRLTYYNLLASSYMQTKQYDLAAPLYETLKQLEPENPNFLLALGIVYQAQGKLLLSQTYYKKALKVAPEGWASFSFATTQLQGMGNMG